MKHKKDFQSTHNLLHARQQKGTQRGTPIARVIATCMALLLVLVTSNVFLLGRVAGATPTEGEASSATVLIYMNGSDLESEGGEATSDIAEMLESGIGNTANVVIETLGTREWQDYGIASDHAQRYAVKDGKLELVDDSLGQLDTTESSTLADFIRWGVENYPADRYMLVMWDHGAGPVYGFGYDEWQAEEKALTLDEIQQALEQNGNVHFDFIGMDCCIMSSLETYYVLQPHCDYAILSEDFEPGVGWSYASWMSMLEKNPAINTVELGTTIVDEMINEVAKDPENGDATLALVDSSAVPALYEAWIAFAYENKDALLETNYSQETSQHGRFYTGGHAGGYAGNHTSDYPGLGVRDEGFDEGYGHGMPDMQNGEGWYGGPDWQGSNDWSGMPDWQGSNDWSGMPDMQNGEGWQGSTDWYDMWDSDASYVTMSDYFVTDIMAVASSKDSAKAEALEAALNKAIVHYGCTSGETGMTGIGVTLPYGDAEFYDQLKDVFLACEIDGDYVSWLKSFVEAEGVNNHFDYESFDEAWQGWGDYPFAA